MPIEHVTGSERTELERHFGPLQNVGTRGDLVRVPDEISKPHREINAAGDVVAVHADVEKAHDAARSPVRTDVPSKAKGEEDKTSAEEQKKVEADAEEDKADE